MTLLHRLPSDVANQAIYRYEEKVLLVHWEYDIRWFIGVLELFIERAFRAGMNIIVRWLLTLFLMGALACGHWRSPAPRVEAEDEDLKNLPPEYVFVDTKSQTVNFVRDGQTIKSFENAAFGVAGAGIKRRQGDGITPRGRYLVTAIRPSQKFRTFIEINYPLRQDVERGLREGVIDEQQYQELMGAIARGELPSQKSPLGGWLGLHGLGHNNIKIHREVDWTGGCVALENHQIDELVKLIRVGTTVVIK